MSKRLGGCSESDFSTCVECGNGITIRIHGPVVNAREVDDVIPCLHTAAAECFRLEVFFLFLNTIGNSQNMLFDNRGLAEQSILVFS